LGVNIIKSSSDLSLTSLQVLKFNPVNIYSVILPIPGIFLTGSFSKNVKTAAFDYSTIHKPLGLLISDANLATILFGPIPQLAVNLLA
jgi:hypothetical protein